MRDKDALVVLDGALHALDNIKFDLTGDTASLDAPDPTDAAAAVAAPAPVAPAARVAGGPGSLRVAAPRSGSFGSSAEPPGASVVVALAGAGMAAANGTYACTDAAAPVFTHPGGFVIERMVGMAVSSAGAKDDAQRWVVRDPAGEVLYVTPATRSGADALPPTEGWQATPGRAPEPSVAVHQFESPREAGPAAGPGGPVADGWVAAVEVGATAAVPVRRPPVVAAIEERKNRIRAKQRRKEAMATAAAAKDVAASAVIDSEAGISSRTTQLTQAEPRVSPRVPAGAAAGLDTPHPGVEEPAELAVPDVPLGAGLPHGGISATDVEAAALVGDAGGGSGEAAAGGVATANSDRGVVEPSSAVFDAGVDELVDAILRANPRVPVVGEDRAVAVRSHVQESLGRQAVADSSATLAAAPAADAAGVAPIIASSTSTFSVVPVRAEPLLGFEDVRTAALLSGLSSKAILCGAVPADAVRLRALPFVCPDGTMAVVVALEVTTVVAGKVAACLGTARAREATPREASERCGYDIRWFPPMGHRVDFRTLVDASVRTTGWDRASIYVAPAGSAEAFVCFESADQLVSALNSKLADVAAGDRSAPLPVAVAPSPESARKRAILRSRTRSGASRSGNSAPVSGIVAPVAVETLASSARARSRAPSPTAALRSGVGKAVGRAAPVSVVTAAPAAVAKPAGTITKVGDDTGAGAADLGSTDDSDGDAATPTPIMPANAMRGVSKPRAIPVAVGGGGGGGGTSSGGIGGGGSSVVGGAGRSSYLPGTSVGMGECESYTRPLVRRA